MRGSQYKKPSSTTTRIPPIVFAALARIKSCPDCTAALLNEMETWLFKRQKHLHANAKRVYPFWKVCLICSKPWPALTKEQALRNRHCPACRWIALSAAKRGQSTGRRSPWGSFTCPTCKTVIERRLKSVQHQERVFCSHSCRAKAHSAHLPEVARLGHLGWSDERWQQLRQHWIGAANPAWKGGATWIRKRGNYPAIKYVRCPETFLAMARKDGYVMEHRLLVAQAMERPLLRSEVVHHWNHDPTDNRLENLALFASNSDHKRFEHRGSPPPIWSGSSLSTM